jgi:hypothetical protein
MGRTRRIVLAIALVAVLLATSWFAAGNLRASSLARDYFLHAHAAAAVTDVVVESESPWVPPFWQVRVSGTVTEAGGAGYVSAMWLLVEPISGVVLQNGAG